MKRFRCRNENYLVLVWVIKLTCYMYTGQKITCFLVGNENGLGFCVGGTRRIDFSVGDGIRPEFNVGIIIDWVSCGGRK